MIPSCLYEDQILSSLWVIFIILIIVCFIIFYVACFLWVSKGNLDLPTSVPSRKYTILKSSSERPLMEDDEVFTVERLAPIFKK